MLLFSRSCKALCRDEIEIYAWSDACLQQYWGWCCVRPHLKLISLGLLLSMFICFMTPSMEPDAFAKEVALLWKILFCIGRSFCRTRVYCNAVAGF